MVRGIAWDSLPSRYEPEKEKPKAKAETTPTEIAHQPFEFSRDIPDIGRRIAFGAICGSITGACFGLVEVLRDPAAMSGKRSVATAKVFRFTGMFSGFFAAYHGSRKILQVAIPMSKENNILTAAALCMFPLAGVAALRPLAPYGVMLVAIDAYNELSGPQ